MEEKKEVFRMPIEVKRIIREEHREPVPDDVRILFSLDDMIMYLINYLEDRYMHKENHNPTYSEYNETMAKTCADEFGDWYWTLFSKGRRCTRLVSPI